MEIHEKAWESQNYLKKVVTNPGYMKGDFEIVLETLLLPDAGHCPNPMERSTQFPTLVLNIGDPKAKRLSCSLGRDKADHLKGGARGPLTSDWTNSADPVMTCYKQASFFGYKIPNTPFTKVTKLHPCCIT